MPPSSPTFDPETLRRGLRAYQADGVCSQIRDSLLSGPLLVAYALLLGASNTQVSGVPSVLSRSKPMTWWAAGRWC